MRVFLASLLCVGSAVCQTAAPLRIRAFVPGKPGGNVYISRPKIQAFWVGADVVAASFANVCAEAIVDIDRKRSRALRDLMMRVAGDRALSERKVGRASAVAAILAGGEPHVAISQNTDVCAELAEVLGAKRAVPRFVRSWDRATRSVDWSIATPRGLWSESAELQGLWRSAMYIRHFDWLKPAQHAFLQSVDASPQWELWKAFVGVDQLLWADGLDAFLGEKRGGRRTLYPQRWHVRKPGDWLRRVVRPGDSPRDADVHVAMGKWLRDPSDRVEGSFLGLMKRAMRKLLESGDAGLAFESDAVKRAVQHQRQRVVLHTWCSMYQAGLLASGGPTTGRLPTDGIRLFVEPCAPFYKAVKRALLRLREARERVCTTEARRDSVLWLLRICEFLIAACDKQGAFVTEGSDAASLIHNLSGIQDDPTRGMPCSMGPLTFKKTACRRCTVLVEHGGAEFRARGMLVDVRRTR